MKSVAFELLQLDEKNVSVSVFKCQDQDQVVY